MMKKAPLNELEAVLKEQTILFNQYDKEIYLLFIQSLPKALVIINELAKIDSYPLIRYHSWDLKPDDFGLLRFNHSYGKNFEILSKSFENFYNAFQKPFKEFLRPLLEDNPNHKYNGVDIYLQSNLLKHPNLKKQISEFENKYLINFVDDHKTHKKFIL